MLRLMEEPMQESGLVPFVRLFPQQAMQETRVLTTQGYPGLPDDEYGLLEFYCADSECNCRRVMINVAGRTQDAILASISYSFDRNQEWAGPFLDPLNAQSEYAGILLRLVVQVLADPAYVARLEAHYDRVKGAVADPAQRFLDGPQGMKGWGRRAPGVNRRSAEGLPDPEGMMRQSRDQEREERIHNEIIVDAHDTEEQAMGWYYYLEENLHFPFSARCTAERAVSPLRTGDEVEIIGMAPEEECEHEMFVLTPWGGRSLAVPLSQLEGADVAEETRQAIDDWHYWVACGYEL